MADRGIMPYGIRSVALTWFGHACTGSDSFVFCFHHRHEFADSVGVRLSAGWRGSLSLHQNDYTVMPNKITAHNAGWSPQFRFADSVFCSGVCEFQR